MLAKLFIVAAGALALASAQPGRDSGLDAPRTGFVRDSAGALRALTGLGGSFYWSESLLQEVRGVNWASPRGTAITGDGRVLILGSFGEVLRAEELGPDAGKAIPGFWDGVPVVFTGESGRLLVLRDESTELVPLRFLVGEEVLAIHGSGTKILAAVTRDDGTFLYAIRAATGEVASVERLPDARQVVILAEERLLWADGSRLCFRGPDQSVVEVDLPAQIALVRQMEREWVHATVADGRQFAVRFRSGSPEPRVFQIPEVAEK